MDLTTVTHQTFLDVLNQVFTLSAVESSAVAEASASLELTAVELLSQSLSESSQPFVLVFRGSDSAILPQSIYRLQHDQLGAIELFLVPVAASADGPVYEAIFN